MRSALPVRACKRKEKKSCRAGAGVVFFFFEKRVVFRWLLPGLRWNRIYWLGARDVMLQFHRRAYPPGHPAPDRLLMPLPSMYMYAPTPKL